jgi:hypothetical protein
MNKTYIYKKANWGDTFGQEIVQFPILSPKGMNDQTSWENIPPPPAQSESVLRCGKRHGQNISK